MAYRISRSALGAFAVLLATPLAADVKRGVDAWSAGDYSAAVEEWRGPAEAGDPDALFNLAQAYRLGRGVDADIHRARELYAKAAQKGHIKATDNYGLLLFQQGRQAEAMPLIRGAAARGDPRAQYVLGLAHFNADYAEKDWVRAYALMSLSNAAGLPQAKDALEQMDIYIPLAERQQAQILARSLEEQAQASRAAQLATADLQRAAPSPPAARAPAPAQSRPVPVLLRDDPRVDEAANQAATPAPNVATASTAPRPQTSASSPSPTASSPATNPAPKAASTSQWAVQLGAFSVPGNADRLWDKLNGNPALAGAEKTIVPGRKLTFLFATGFGSRSDAQRACAELKRGGQDCLVTKPTA